MTRLLLSEGCKVRGRTREDRAEEGEAENQTLEQSPRPIIGTGRDGLATLGSGLFVCSRLLSPSMKEERTFIDHRHLTEQRSQRDPLKIL